MVQILPVLFTKRIRFRSRAMLVTGALFIGLIVVQAVFFYLQNTQVESAERAIRSLLRQELVVSNMFLLSRAVSDIQDSGLVKCMVVRKSGIDIPYLDLRYLSTCETGFLRLEGKQVTSKFTALNGESWNVSFLASTGRFFFISLWLARSIISFIIIAAMSYYFIRLDREASLRQRKEIENAILNKLVEQKAAEVTHLKIEASIQKSLTEMAQQVSHDIRSPLSALNIVVKSLVGVPEDQRRVIQVASDRINGIANDLLQRYRTKAATISTEETIAPSASIFKKKVILSNLLRTTFLEKQTVFGRRKGLQLKLDLTGPTDATVEVDEKELARVLSNLLNNAVEALEAEGTVTLALRSSLNHVVVIVSDNGKGIPENILVRLGKEKISIGKDGTESGSGIGVFHARSVTEAMGGRFNIQSKVGMGTIITLTFPRSDLGLHS